MKRFWFLLSLSFLLNSAFGFNKYIQQPTDSIPAFDQNYIEDISHSFGLYLYGKEKYSRFFIKDKISKKTAIFNPNEQLNLGFGFIYDGFGLGIAFNFSFINNDNDRYGNTKRIDMQTNLYSRNTMLDLYILNYKGFYIKNTDDFIENPIAGHPYIIRPDIKTFAIGASLLHIDNHEKFSFRSSFLQSDIQKKSAGSLLYGAVFSIYRLKAEDGIQIENFKNPSNDPLLIKTVNVLNIGVSAGYAYTLVIKEKWFFTLSLAPALLFKSYSLTDDNNRALRSKDFIAFRGQLKAACGYNSKSYFIAFTYLNDNFLQDYFHHKDMPGFKYEVSNFKFIIGKRLNLHIPWKLPFFKRK